MIENLLKFGCRFGVSVRGTQGLTTHVRRVQTAKKMTEVDAIHSQFVGQSDLQLLTLSAGLPRPSAASARRTGA